MSMSWMIKDKPGNGIGTNYLKTTIEEVARRGTNLFRTSDDVDAYKMRKPPLASSDTKMIRKVGSCDENGNKSSFVDQANVDYLLPSEKREEFKSWKSTDKGSSAPKALASVPAFLFLYCSERHGYNKEDLAKSRMIALFKLFLAWTTTKIVYQGLR
ncbi:hypothetical protein EJ04DRAFT_528902 [Polyplosphaeria fusca]|uniref:Uncharacterized protein n=1 Tax=Polyplosphaeria fusca TaxID=682080 RepID=A0A9P4QNP5_9PLEO|nr:hypothetical protein EJ04DRAFT_528902 [Polyplosphaeria fusca]